MKKYVHDWGCYLAAIVFVIAILGVLLAITYSPLWLLLTVSAIIGGALIGHGLWIHDRIDDLDDGLRRVEAELLKRVSD